MRVPAHMDISDEIEERASEGEKRTNRELSIKIAFSNYYRYICIKHGMGMGMGNDSVSTNIHLIKYQIIYSSIYHQ